MRVFCNGFNLYKKFKSKQPLIKKFEKFDYDEDIVDVEVSLTYAVFKSKNHELFLTGGNYNGVQKIDYNFGTIISLSCTNDHIFVLNKNGMLFQVDIVNLDKIDQVPNEGLMQDDKFILFAISDKIKVGLTKFGYIYDLPRKTDFDIHSSVDIKIGGMHCLILDSRGNVYSFGNGSRGQLGLGTLEDQSNPRQIEALAGIPIVAIACGTWHCAVISKDGDLYTWGWNQNGQLGLPVHSLKNKDGVSVMASPHVVDFPDPNACAVKIACGKRHTIVLLDNGELYGCGMNKYKQLKDDSREMIEMMTFIQDFSQETVVDVKCGPWNSVVCCENS